MKENKDRIKRYLILLVVFALIISGAIYYYIAKGASSEPKLELKNQSTDFEIDQLLIKLLLKEKEHTLKSVRISNTGQNESYFVVTVRGVTDLISIQDANFLLKPGQAKVVLLNFSTQLEDKIEYQPGIYVGKLEVSSGDTIKVVPIITEIESKEVLFDMNLNLLARDRNIMQGEETTIEVRLFNLQSVAAVNIDMEYNVLDLDGNTIITEGETVVVKNQVSFFKTIKIPSNLNPVNYVFVAKARYGSSTGTASYLFEVIPKEEAVREVSITEITTYCGKDPFCWSMLIAWVIIIVFFGIYLYFIIGDWLLYGIGRLIKFIHPFKAKELKAKEPIVKKEVKPELRNKLIMFRERLWKIEQHIKYDRIKEAFEDYAKLKEAYRGLVYSHLSKKGKQVLYHKISDVYKELSKFRK